MDQNSMRDAPLLTCRSCKHLDSTETSDIGTTGLCSLCDTNIGQWHGKFPRRLQSVDADPISDEVVDRVLAEFPEFKETIDPKLIN